jgi:hypothetical protein
LRRCSVPSQFGNDAPSIRNTSTWAAVSTATVP